jgi:hypothetical protein
MTLPQYRRLFQGRDTLDRSQSNLQNWINTLRGTYVDGDVIENLTLTAGQDNTVNHLLGRKGIGWAVLTSTKQTMVSEDETLRTDDAFILHTLVTTEVDLLVF